MWSCLRDPMFNRFSRTPTCAHRHTSTAYTALAWRRALKTKATLLANDTVPNGLKRADSNCQCLASPVPDGIIYGRPM